MRLTPLLLIASAFLAGLSLASLLPPIPLISGGLALFLFVALYIIIRTRLLGHRALPHLKTEISPPLFSPFFSPFFSFLLFLLFFLFGAVRGLVADIVAPNDVSRLAPAIVTVRGRVVSEGTEKRRQSSGYRRFTLEAESVEAGAGRTASVSGKLEVGLPIEETGKRPGYGDWLVVRGKLERPEGIRNPGGFDYDTHLARQGIYATLTARRLADWHIEAKSGKEIWLTDPLLWLADRLHNGVLDHGRAMHNAEMAGVLNGILLGDRGDMAGSLNDDFERTGTSHLLATAGLHVGLVLGLLLAFLRLCRVARRPALLITALMLGLYAFMAGGRPSVVRAVVMASVVLCGMVLEREPYLPNTLALAALLLLGVHPRQIFAPGFQLSFATVITLAIWMPLTRPLLDSSLKMMERRLSGGETVKLKIEWLKIKWFKLVGETLVACFCLSAVAFVGAAPLVALYFNEVSLVSILANLLVVPLAGLILALGFGAAFLGLFYPPLSWPLDRLLEPLLAWVVGAVRACSQLPCAVLSCASPAIWQLCLGYLLLWATGYYLRFRSGVTDISRAESPAE